MADESRDPPAVALLLVAVGATAAVLDAADVLPGGWLGLDVALTAAGYLLARPGARLVAGPVAATDASRRTDRSDAADETHPAHPSGEPGRADPTRGADVTEPIDAADPTEPAGRRTVVRSLVGVTVVAVLAVALGLAVGRVPAGAVVRGDLLATGLLHADVRAALADGPLVAGGARGATGGLWVTTLLVQAALVAWLVGRLVRDRLGRNVVAGALALESVMVGGWAVAVGWDPAAVLAGPWFRGLGLAAGFAVGAGLRGRAAAARVAWPAAALALVALFVLAAPDRTGTVVAAAVAAVVLTGVLLVGVDVRLPGLTGAADRTAPVLIAAAVALTAGPAWVAVVADSGDGAGRRAAAAVFSVVASVVVGRAVHALVVGLPPGDLVDVAAPPVAFGALALALVLSGFFHATDPVVVDAQRAADPQGLRLPIAQVDAIPAPRSFCRSSDVADLAHTLGSLQRAILDEGEARRALASAPEVDWAALAHDAPNRQIAQAIQALASDPASVSSSLHALGEAARAGNATFGQDQAALVTPELIGYLTLSGYLERRCRVVVRD
jgi:hypothetical protein